LRDKDLGGTQKESKFLGVTVIRLACSLESMRTAPVCAFHIEGQGYMSQRRGKFVWRAVEKCGVDAGRSGGLIPVPQTTRSHGRV